MHEAFASIPLTWAQECAVDEERLNPTGGAIVLGHTLPLAVPGDDHHG